DWSTLQSAQRAVPVRTLGQLTTSIDGLHYSPDGRWLVMHSRRKREALCLVRASSLAVEPGWPTAGTPLHYVHCCAFSQVGAHQLLSVGNDRGRALLYRVV